MCSLTYIAQEDHFIFTHSRDEDRQRPASSTIKQQQLGPQQVCFPQDLQASGTWMALSSQGVAACILNGGRVPYKRRSSYPKSRGAIIPALFDYKADIQYFRDDFSFRDYEPFTLIVKEKGRLWALYHDPEWDELQEFDPLGAHLWSSTRLYGEQERRRRAADFYRWLRLQKYRSPSALSRLHLQGSPDYGIQGFLMDREDLATVSLTQITLRAPQGQMYYRQLLESTEDKVELSFD